jgi:hypothetical protein
VTDDPTELFPTGVDESGSLLSAKLSIAELAKAIRSRGAGSLSPAVVAANTRAGLESLGLPIGVTAGDLSRAGWAVVFADDVPQDVRGKLKPLLERRAKQAGTRYKELCYKVADNESVRDWLQRHNVAFGSITPSRIPYHLMLVGSPKSISFEFQYLLDLEYSVGRLWFDREAGFANYASSVINYETSAEIPTKKEVIYFAPSRSDDDATILSATQLVKPLFDGTSEEVAIATECGFTATPLIGDDAKKQALVDILHDTARRPGLLFSASHGLNCPNGSANQRTRQGALVTAEWTGEAIDAAKLFAADDVRDDAAIHGMIAFMFACYGAGTPQVDQFSMDLATAAPPQAIAPEPFIAALPQRLLGHPGGGALAVIGHVERAWAYSIQPPKVDPQLVPFRNAIGRILTGEPVGQSTQDLTARHAMLSTELATLLAPNAPPIPDLVLVRRWLEKTDARNYILLGDPAIRIRAADMA